MLWQNFRWHYERVDHPYLWWHQVADLQQGILLHPENQNHWFNKYRSQSNSQPTTRISRLLIEKVLDQSRGVFNLWIWLLNSRTRKPRHRKVQNLYISSWVERDSRTTSDFNCNHSCKLNEKSTANTEW